MLEKLTYLTVEATDFALVAERTQRFCPFEAIGMIRQEIRHSSFLSYLLDPSRPHGIGDVALRALLLVLAEDDPNKLPDHQPRNLSTARVWRERDHIDLLIEIPSKNELGLIIAIEVKVDAAEREAQLSDYSRKVNNRYPPDTWNHLLCFLTPDGRAGMTQGADEWQSLSFGKLLRAIEIAIKDNGMFGEGVKLFDYYHTMMKRHDIVQDSSDPELDQAVLAVWAKHKETLDYLLAHRPDPFSDVMRELDRDQSAISQRLESKCGEKIQADSKSGRYRRFSFPNFANNCSDFFRGNTRWVSSGAQLLLELTVENEQVIASFCVGPRLDLQGEVNEFRSKLIKELDGVTGQDKKIPQSAKHYWRGSLLTWDDFENAEQETHLEVLEEKLAQFVKTHLDDVRMAVQAACNHQHNDE